MCKPIQMALHQSRHSCEWSTLYGKLNREEFQARKWEICLDRQKEKRRILLQKTLMSHKMIERWGGMV